METIILRLTNIKSFQRLSTKSQDRKHKHFLDCGSEGQIVTRARMRAGSVIDPLVPVIPTNFKHLPVHLSIDFSHFRFFHISDSLLIQ